MHLESTLEMLYSHMGNYVKEKYRSVWRLLCIAIGFVHYVDTCDRRRYASGKHSIYCIPFRQVFVLA